MTDGLQSMTDWEKVATASGYKNAANAKTMFSRLCKNKLEKSTDDGKHTSSLVLHDSPAHAIADTKAPKATKTQGKRKAQPKPAGKTTKVKEEEEDDDDEEGFGDTGVEEEKEDEDEESK